MQFCPKCENLMLVKDKKKGKILQCTSCGYETPFDNNKHKELYTIVQTIKHGSKDKTHIIKKANRGPSVTEDDRELMDDDIDYTEME